MNLHANNKSDESAQIDSCSTGKQVGNWYGAVQEHIHTENIHRIKLASLSDIFFLWYCSKSLLLLSSPVMEYLFTCIIMQCIYAVLKQARYLFH